MAGERWVQVREMFAQLDDEKLESAAYEWDSVQADVEKVANGFAGPHGDLRDSQVFAEVRDPLFDVADRTQRALTRAAEELKAPQGILRSLAYYIRQMRRHIAEKEIGGDGGAPFPALLSGDPDQRLLQEIQLGLFDELADMYVAGLLSQLAQATADLWVAGPEFPETLPQGDPSADLSALGVPAGPR